MNEQLAQALGIKFARNRKGMSSSARYDLRISKSKDGRYTLSFSIKCAKKLGDYVRVAATDKRLYIVSGCKDEYGFKMAGKEGYRRYVYLTPSTIGFIDKFVGDHELQYYEDLDAYYVTAKGVEQ